MHAKKVYKVVDPQNPNTSSPQVVTDTDWDKCMFCQKTISDAILHCPGKSKSSAGYKTVAAHLLAFQEIGCLPENLQLSRLDDGEGIEKTLQKHNGKWHDTCRLKYNKTELKRAEKRRHSRDRSPDPPKKYTRQSSGESSSSAVPICFFCDKPEDSRTLHEARTLHIDDHVWECALKLGDKPLLTKLGARDMRAQDAMYHLECLTSLYNRARLYKSLDDEMDCDKSNHSIALADLVSYIDETGRNSEIAPVFKMVDLCNLYKRRLQELGTNFTGRVHSTHLKNRILEFCPDLKSTMSGRDMVLIFNKDIGQAVRKACEYDADDDAVHLARAANILRRDILRMKTVFSNSFDTDCQKKSVPASLLQMVGMVLDGPKINGVGSIDNSPMNAAQLSISQLLMFNTNVRRREGVSGIVRHNKQRETPLPVYLGMMIHTKTRKRELVDTLFDLGLCISYNRVLDISTDLGNKVCHQYAVEKAVCPPNLRSGLFTTAAVDNIDHNPSSTSAHDSFHGTGISLFQHPSRVNSGDPRGLPFDNLSNIESERTLSKLPDSYTSVPPLAFKKRDITVPNVDGPCQPNCHLVPDALQKEYRYVYLLIDECIHDIERDHLQNYSTVESWVWLNL
jgi:hypothetical protein